MTTDQIIDAIRERCELHPELTAPLRWDGLRRILARENVALLTVDLPRPAQLVQYRGEWGILLDRRAPPRRRLYYATHELGHLWLHHDRTCERWETVYNMGYDVGPDPREDEVETFCILVLGEHRYY